jgi:hypothetical protein
MPRSRIRILNIKETMPTVEEARKMLIAELQMAKQSGIAAIKLIHGYGSTGVGGALRPALRRSLLLRKKEGLVSKIIFGEKWSIFEHDTRYALERYPELRDSDLDRSNEGITIVLLRD